MRRLRADLPLLAIAVWLQLTGAADFAGRIREGSEAAMFALLDALPLSLVTTVITAVLVALYFVTSADSASLVLGSLSTRGSLHPPRTLVVMWGVLVGAVALVLLLAGGCRRCSRRRSWSRCRSWWSCCCSAWRW
ncbi:BCCT family transporter [Nonomuraea aridisoli]|uniref:BCCT family transporter n=1 Tax=Nonomuraea aridisoli TaxID=2070368 RepID=UPI001C652388|nr:BCCT family transporter [Nonomuraea aridisoli]